MITTNQTNDIFLRSTLITIRMVQSKIFDKVSIYNRN